jgi:Domain of unknown function (DUF1844)
MSQEPKSFTVNDRRHFTSEGEPREETEERSAPEPERKAQDPKPAEAAQAFEAPPAASAEQPGSAPRRDAEAAELGPFILSLAAQASYLLAAEGEDAVSGLEDARHIIAILEMLKDKTEGRRTAGEDQIVEGVLYELRMGYVARTRVGGA